MSTINLGSDLQLSMSGLLIHDDQQDITRKPVQNDEEDKMEPQTSNSGETESDTATILRSICLHFIEDMNKFGIAVLDSFLGNERGDLVYEEVINLHRAGLFTDGQLVRNETKNKDIRGDEIIWIVGNEGDCPHISGLINDIDKIVKGACKYANNGELGKYKIDGRTKVSILHSRMNDFDVFIYLNLINILVKLFSYEPIFTCFLLTTFVGSSICLILSRHPR